MEKHLAILLTCHNRREKTIVCLRNFYNVDIPNGINVEVYLVDDGSIDGTSEEIHQMFPEVNIIKGTGNLYWNGGMRLAWYSAIDSGIDFDYFLWLNDDTFIFKYALEELFSVFENALKVDCKPPLITGACQESKDNAIFSYGGRTNKGPVLPNGKLQKCRRINGNFVLIPKAIYIKVGMLSEKYTHSMGDFDYSVRVIENGFNCYTTTRFIGICKTNEGIPIWCNPEKPLKQRWSHFHHPTGINIKEYKTFLKVHSKNWKLEIIKVYLKMLTPKLYRIIAKE